MKILNKVRALQKEKIKARRDGKAKADKERRKFSKEMCFRSLFLKDIARYKSK